VRPLVLALVAAALVAGCSRSAVPRVATNHRKGFERRGWKYPAALDSLIQPKVQATIEGAAAVDAALTKSGLSVSASAEPFEPPAVWGYEPRSPWRRLTPQQAKRLRDLLLDRKGWQTEAKTCTFDPTVVFRWYSGRDTARAFLCHGCDQMAGWEGSKRFGGDLDPSGLSLAELTASIFPEDSLLQAIVARKQLHY